MEEKESKEDECFPAFVQAGNGLLRMEAEKQIGKTWKTIKENESSLSCDSTLESTSLNHSVCGLESEVALTKWQKRKKSSSGLALDFEDIGNYLVSSEFFMIMTARESEKVPESGKYVSVH